MHERTTVSPVLFCFPACVVFPFHTSVIRKELRYAYTTGETTDITNSLDLSSFIAYIRHELEEEGHGVGLVAHVSIVCSQSSTRLSTLQWRVVVYVGVCAYMYVWLRVHAWSTPQSSAVCIACSYTHTLHSMRLR